MMLIMCVGVCFVPTTAFHNGMSCCLFEILTRVFIFFEMKIRIFNPSCSKKCVCSVLLISIFGSFYPNNTVIHDDCQINASRKVGLDKSVMCFYTLYTFGIT